MPVKFIIAADLHQSIGKLRAVDAPACVPAIDGMAIPRHHRMSGVVQFIPT